MRVVVVGAAGRTGRHIVKAVLDSPDVRLWGAVDHVEHPDQGKDAALLAGAMSEGGVVNLSSDLSAALDGAESLIDFSTADAAPRNAAAAAAAGVPFVIGTTSLGEEAEAALVAAAKQVPVVQAPNMSVGVNVVLELLAQAAKLLGPSFDFEIFEMHHKHKVDSPSGTALRMAEVVAQERGIDLNTRGRHGRQGNLGVRPGDEIGVHAARGGDVVGDHTAIFAGMGERVEIIHRAHGRDTFAQGAVRAASWARGRDAGLYDMRDVLEVRTR